jgi:hypothetical protein
MHSRFKLMYAVSHAYLDPWLNRRVCVLLFFLCRLASVSSSPCAFFVSVLDYAMKKDNAIKIPKALHWPLGAMCLQIRAYAHVQLPE